MKKKPIDNSIYQLTYQFYYLHLTSELSHTDYMPAFKATLSEQVATTIIMRNGEKSYDGLCMMEYTIHDSRCVKEGVVSASC